MQDTILNQILQNQNAMSEKIGGITEIVKRHDEVTFPNIEGTLTRIESKHNQDYLQFIAEKEALNRRLLPLESDYNKRVQRGDSVKKGWTSIAWAVIEKGVLIAIGTLIVSWRQVLEHFK